MNTSLPPTDPPAMDDTLPGEAELAALYRQLPQSEPSAALDATVLRAAALALESADENPPRTERREIPLPSPGRRRTRPLSAIAARTTSSTPSIAHARRRRLPRWLIGLGSAASLVLVAGLAWHMRDVPDARLKPAVVADDSQAKTASTPPSPPTDADAANQTEGSTPVSAARMQARAIAQPQRQANHSPRLALPGFKSAAPGRPLTTIEPQTLTGNPLPQHDAAAMDATRRAVREKHAASAPRLPAGADESRMMVTPSAVMEVMPVAPPAPISPQRTTTAAEPGDTPELELAKIQQLVQQHRGAEATRRLQAFHRAYPQWSLPADLRELLSEP